LVKVFVFRSNVFYYLLIEDRSAICSCQVGSPLSILLSHRRDQQHLQVTHDGRSNAGATNTQARYGSLQNAQISDYLSSIWRMKLDDEILSDDMLMMNFGTNFLNFDKLMICSFNYDKSVFIGKPFQISIRLDSQCKIQRQVGC
jgi:outer membrane receptor for ferrienterochelin and colicin